MVVWISVILSFLCLVVLLLHCPIDLLPGCLVIVWLFGCNVVRLSCFFFFFLLSPCPFVQFVFLSGCLVVPLSLLRCPDVWLFSVQSCDLLDSIVFSVFEVILLQFYKYRIWNEQACQNLRIFWRQILFWKWCQCQNIFDKCEVWPPQHDDCNSERLIQCAQEEGHTQQSSKHCKNKGKRNNQAYIAIEVAMKCDNVYGQH